MLRGSEENTWTAQRNTTGKGIVSAILVRALLSALAGLHPAAARPDHGRANGG
jgi:hypothetical protein